MIYLIGGPPRSGKTMIAERLSDTLGSRYVSLDALRQKLEQDNPELGVRNGNDAELNAGRMWEQVKTLIQQESARGSCVIEGADLEPLLVRELLPDDNMRLLFVGYGSISVADKIAAIKAHAETREWMTSMGDAELERVIGEEISRSQRFQKQCQKFGIKYIDMSLDFSQALVAACAYLIGV